MAAAAKPLDWSGFLRVVRRHRIQGLVWHGLGRTKVAVPTDIAAALKADAAKTARTGLSFCAEAIRLQRLFDQAGIRGAFLKGTTLALLAYRNLAVRHAKDIDLIVPETDLAGVGDLLIAAGYRRQRPPPEISGAQLDLWYRYSKDMEWRHDAKGIELELHWRLSPTSFLLKEPVDFSMLDAVELGPSTRVMTLPPAELFSYLCAHGASHCWIRLKWLADIHGLIADLPEARIWAYYRLAKAQKNDRAVGQALLLCADLFGLRLPADLAAELRRSRVVRLLSGMAHLCLTRGNAQIEIYDLPFGTTLVSVSHLLLAPNLKAAITEVWRKGVNLDDIHRFPLPRSLAFLYRLLRWPLWLCRRVLNAGASTVE